MSTTSKGSDSSFEQAPPGTHVARLINLFDIGPQKESYDGRESIRAKLILRFELPTELMEDGKPFIISTWVTNSLFKSSKLRKWLKAWRGRDFTKEELDDGYDVANAVGQCCMLSILINENDKAYIDGVSQLPKQITIPEQHNPTVIFNMDTDMDKLGEQPEWIQKLVNQSISLQPKKEPIAPPQKTFKEQIPDAQTHGTPSSPNESDFDDDIPF